MYFKFWTIAKNDDQSALQSTLVVQHKVLMVVLFVQLKLHMEAHPAEEQAGFKSDWNTSSSSSWVLC